jgi:hypothetical protein
MNDNENYGIHYNRRYPEKQPPKENRIKKFGKAVLYLALATVVSVGIAEGVKATIERGKPVQFSNTMKEWVAKKGQGTLDAAWDVGNVNDGNVSVVKNHIEEENAEALKDGLDEGEALLIPTNVIIDDETVKH